MGGDGGGCVAGSSETKANLAQLGLELRLSLAILIEVDKKFLEGFDFVCNGISQKLSGILDHRILPLRSPG